MSKYRIKRFSIDFQDDLRYNTIISKDSRRYKSAQDALKDLQKIHGSSIQIDPESIELNKVGRVTYYDGVRSDKDPSRDNDPVKNLLRRKVFSGSKGLTKRQAEGAKKVAEESLSKGGDPISENTSTSIIETTNTVVSKEGKKRNNHKSQKKVDKFIDNSIDDSESSDEVDDITTAALSDEDRPERIDQVIRKSRSKKASLNN